MEERRKKRRRILASMITLLIIVIVLPLISLKYLKEGLDYRQDRLAELAELGKVDSYKAVSTDGKSIDHNKLGNVIVVSDEMLACDGQHGQTLREYVEKFENQDVFRHVILTSGKDCTGWKKSFIAAEENGQALGRQLSKLASMDDLNKKVILIDRENEIRQVYDLTKRADIELLVTHTTILMPPLKKRG